MPPGLASVAANSGPLSKANSTMARTLDMLVSMEVAGYSASDQPRMQAAKLAQGGVGLPAATPRARSKPLRSVRCVRHLRRRKRPCNRAVLDEAQATPNRPAAGRGDHTLLADLTPVVVEADADALGRAWIGGHLVAQPAFEQQQLAGPGRHHYPGPV